MFANLNRRTFLLAAVLCLAGLASPFSAWAEEGAPAAKKKTLDVFAAASLTDAFKTLGKQFEAQEAGVAVVFNFGASNQLRTQLEQGAKADIFVSANKKEMDAAIASKAVADGAAKPFVWNRLVVLVPKDNPGQVATLKDLAKPKLKLVLADKAVPVGKYALDMFDKLAADAEYGPAYKEQALANVVSREENVKAVVTKVRMGEADAGVAYVSDLTGKDSDKLAMIPVPDKFNQIASYPIAPVAKSEQQELAAKFIEYLLSPAGKEVLKANGFIVDPPAGNK